MCSVVVASVLYAILTYERLQRFHLWIAGDTCVWTAWMGRIQAQADLDLNPISVS